MSRWLWVREHGFAVLIVCALWSAPLRSTAMAQTSGPAGKLVSTLARYCVVTGADPIKVGLGVGPEWQVVKELTDEQISALGGAFSSYDAWNIPKGVGKETLLLVTGVEKQPGGTRHICSVQGVEEGDTIAEVRTLMGGARPFFRNETMWAAFGWLEGDRVREPTESEMMANMENVQNRVAFTVTHERDRVTVSLSRMVLAPPQK